MVIPCSFASKFGVSMIKKQSNKVSLHLVSVFSENEPNLMAKDYDSGDEKSGVSLEKADSEFPFSNPLITTDALKVLEFFIEANKFAKRCSL